MPACTPVAGLRQAHAWRNNVHSRRVALAALGQQSEAEKSIVRHRSSHPGSCIIEGQAESQRIHYVAHASRRTSRLCRSDCAAPCGLPCSRGRVFFFCPGHGQGTYSLSGNTLRLRETCVLRRSALCTVCAPAAARSCSHAHPAVFPVQAPSEGTCRHGRHARPVPSPHASTPSHRTSGSDHAISADSTAISGSYSS